MNFMFGDNSGIERKGDEHAKLFSNAEQVDMERLARSHDLVAGGQERQEEGHDEASKGDLVAKDLGRREVEIRGIIGGFYVNGF